MLGGDKDNAIPRDCEAVILPCDLDAAKAFLRDGEDLLQELVTSADDSARTLTVREEAVDSALTAEDTGRVLAVTDIPCGVLARRTDGKTPPETSRNLASGSMAKLRQAFNSAKTTCVFSSNRPLSPSGWAVHSCSHFPPEMPQTMA